MSLTCISGTIFRLASRHNALVQLGMINSPEEVPVFARELSVLFFLLIFSQLTARNVISSAQQSLEAQNEIIAELDKWARLQETDSD